MAFLLSKNLAVGIWQKKVPFGVPFCLAQKGNAGARVGFTLTPSAHFSGSEISFFFPK